MNPQFPCQATRSTICKIPAIPNSTMYIFPKGIVQNLMHLSTKRLYVKKDKVHSINGSSWLYSLYGYHGFSIWIAYCHIRYESECVLSKVVLVIGHIEYARLETVKFVSKLKNLKRENSFYIFMTQKQMFETNQMKDGNYIKMFLISFLVYISVETKFIL